MTYFQAAIYGLIQGLTEFLPVSSSAHLVLLPAVTGWPDPGLAFDVALHWGTLIAVVGYFWRDVLALVRDAVTVPTGHPSAEGLLAWKIVAATIPGALIGFCFERRAEEAFRSPALIAGTLAGAGILLAVADRAARQQFTLKELPWAGAIAIGLFQGLAIVPGISRSGITIAMGLFLGLKREDAVRFSFLLAMPIIAGAGLLKFKYILGNAHDPALWVAVLTSAAFGLAAIHVLLRYVRTRTFTVFVVYRIALACAVAAWLCLRG